MSHIITNNQIQISRTLVDLIFFKHPSNHVLIVCLATSSSIIYSNSSLASNSSNCSAFLISTDLYDNILEQSTHTHIIILVPKHT